MSAKAHFPRPMLSLPATSLPEGPQWQYEIKFDGYRALGLRSCAKARLLSRNGKDFSRRFPSIVSALSNLPDETIVDGEIVAFDESGLPSFTVLQNNLRSETTVIFYVFDLLTLEGKEIIHLPLDQRRALLLNKVVAKLSDPVRFSQTIDSPPLQLLEAIREQGLEGAIAKRRDSRYEPGRRSGTWLKVRVNRSHELVIGGYTPGSHRFDGLIVGFYEGKSLMYAATIRSGFTPLLRENLFSRFRNLASDRCPFANLPEPSKGRWGEGLTAKEMTKCHRLKPRLVAAVEFLEWTPTNHLRHAKFVALRDDKSARSVARE
jgi:DNA ligase D-like protein (predicted ligase)